MHIDCNLIPKKKLALTAVAAFMILFGMNRAGAMTVEVKNHLGSPTIMIDGKPQTPLFLFAHPEGRRGPNLEKTFMAQQIRLASQTGVHFFSTNWSIPWPKDGEEPVFKDIDGAIDAMLEIDPKILIMPRLYPIPPKWWMDAHPESVTVYPEGKSKDIFPSIASQDWLKDSIRHMRVLIRHLEAKYGDHFIGYQPEVHEWFYERMGEGGFEEAFRAGFAAWAKKKYQTDERLRQAWKQPQVTFATVRVPTMDERNHPAIGLFYDPISQQFQIDFAEYLNVAIPDAILALSHAIKEETNRTKLTVNFYGYFFEMGGVHQTGHMGVGRVLRSPDIDILTGPLSYDNREPGGTEPMMSVVDAIRDAGKLWLNEDDTRTYLLPPTMKDEMTAWWQKTPQLTLWAHKRQFGHLLPRRLATWYMDLPNQGWVNGKDIWENIGEMKKIYDREMQRPATWNPEVAVVTDERSCFYTRFSKIPDLCYPLRSRILCLPQFLRMGTNFRILLLEDVLAGREKLPKVTMFTNCFHLTPGDREKIQTALKGKTAVWLYGSGYVDDERASTENMTQLTGFSFQESRGDEPVELRFVTGSPLTLGLAQMSYAPPRPTMSPRWSIKPDEKIRAFANFTDGSIAAASRDIKGGGRAFYIGAPNCAAGVLRNILKEAGVRIYIDSDDVLSTDGRFVGLTASTAGPKTILVPKGMNLYREGETAPLAIKDGRFTESMQLGEVQFYRLESKAN